MYLIVEHKLSFIAQKTGNMAHMSEAAILMKPFEDATNKREREIAMLGGFMTHKGHSVITWHTP